MPITINTDKLYDTDLTDAAWALIAPMLPAARRGGRPRTTNIRAVLNAIFYLLRTGCQWRLLPREFPVWSTVYHYFRAWKNGDVWTWVQRSMYQQARRQAGRTACPSVVIMDGQVGEDDGTWRQRAGALLLGGLGALFPNIRTVICRTPKSQARSMPAAARWPEATDRQTSAECVQDHRPHLDCRAQFRLAWPQSTLE